MTMVFCRGCGKELHESAPTCPHCGAPQKSRVTSGTRSANDFWGLAIQPLKKYADFSGRARRKEYWYFVLMLFGLTFVIGFMGGLFGGTQLSNAMSGLVTLATLVPGIAVGVRRMHDTDRTGWWLVLPIVNLIFLCLAGQEGSNRFGEDPKNA